MKNHTQAEADTITRNQTKEKNEDDYVAELDADEKIKKSDVTK